MAPEQRIVVGLDGSPDSWQALDWAAQEAEQTGRALHVVRVDSTSGATHGDMLYDVLGELATRFPMAHASTRRLTGDPVSQLVELSATADLVVIGRGRRGIPRLLHESVANRVLTHARCPTAVIAAGSRETANRIVVGVSDSDGGRAALHFAVAEAERRAAEVVAIHAWSVRDRWLAAEAAVPGSAIDLWEAEERTKLEDRVDPLRDAFPDVKISTVQSTVPLEGVLERESLDAVMLVLGSRRIDDARLPRLGPIAGWAVHHLSCPVVIVGHPARQPAAF